MTGVEGMATVFEWLALGAAIACALCFVGFWLGWAVIILKSFGRVPLNNDELRPFSQAQISRSNDRYQVMQDIETKTRTGRFADYFARRMTFFGIVAALLGGLSALLTR